MKIRFTPLAVADLHELARYARERLNESAVRVLGTTIREATERLGQFPDLGREARMPGVRELVLARINVVVTYQVERQTVAILSVLRSERDRP